MTSVIDAHLHAWDLERADYPWLSPEAGPLYRSFELAETEDVRRAHGVTGVVLVQAADNDDDTAHMLDLARRHSDVAGVVAWAPLDDEDGIARRVNAWRTTNHPVVGVRSLIHERRDREWVLRADVDAGLTVLEAAGIPLDYVTSDPTALIHIPTIVTRRPRLQIVIDHLGKPPIGRGPGPLREWRTILARAAESPQVSAKLSGLYPASGAMDEWTVADLRPVVETALEIFGPGRLMMGSDWPISELAGGYGRTRAALVDLLGGLPASDLAEVLGGTAARVYGLAPSFRTT